MISRALIAVMVCLAVFAPDVRAENWLQSLYRSALARDPALGRSKARHDMAREEEAIALSQLLPRIDAASGVSNIDSTTYNYRPGKMEGQYQGYNYSVTLRQPVYNGSSWSSLAAAGANARSAEAAALLSRQELLSRVAEASLMALRYRAAADYAAGEVLRAEELVVYAEVSLRLGAMDVINRNELKARLDEAKSLAVKSLNESKMAEQDLAIIAGVPSGSLKLPANLSAKLPSPGNYATAEAWLAVAESANPAIIQAREALEAASSEVDAARRGHWPTLDMSGGYAVSKGSTFLPEVETRQWSVGVNLNLPIFAGFGSSARADRARASRLEREFALQGVRDEVRRKIETAFFSLDSAAAVIAAVSQRLNSEREYLASVEKGMVLGVRARTDRLAAMRRLASAERDMAEAGLEGRVAWLRLRSAAGLLKEDDLIEVGQ